MARSVPRVAILLAVLLAGAFACALAASAQTHPRTAVRVIGFSGTGDVMRSSGSSASLRAVATPDQQFAVSGAAMTAAEGIAKAYWGGADACGGAVDVQWTDLPADTNAVSTWSNPSSAYDNPTENSDCHVSFNRLLGFDWPRFCTVLVHEFGHLTGHAHSPDPNNVMTAIYNGPVAVCATAPDPTATPAAAPAPAATPAPVATAASRTVQKTKTGTHRRTRSHRRHKPTRHARTHRHRLHRSHH
jgi:hypothetical protein